MSYSINFVLEQGEDLTKKTFDVFESSGAAEGQRQNGTYTETFNALSIHVLTANMLIQNLPSTWAELYINFSGHCEPTSGQRDGWSPDFRNMSVGIKSFKDQPKQTVTA